MDAPQKQALMAYLQRFVATERQAKIDAVLSRRTGYLTVIAEDFHNVHAASAMLRRIPTMRLVDLIVRVKDALDAVMCLVLF